MGGSVGRIVPIEPTAECGRPRCRPYNEPHVVSHFDRNDAGVGNHPGRLRRPVQHTNCAAAADSPSAQSNDLWRTFLCDRAHRLPRRHSAVTSLRQFSTWCMSRSRVGASRRFGCHRSRYFETCAVRRPGTCHGVTRPVAPGRAVGPPNNEIASLNFDVGVPNVGVALPNSRVALPNTGVALPNFGVHVPNSGVALPNTGVDEPNTGVALPNSGVHVPNSGVALPNFGVALRARQGGDPPCPVDGRPIRAAEPSAYPFYGADGFTGPAVTARPSLRSRGGSGSSPRPSRG
jgi:hypothetical protein